MVSERLQGPLPQLVLAIFMQRYCFSITCSNFHLINFYFVYPLCFSFKWQLLIIHQIFLRYQPISLFYITILHLYIIFLHSCRNFIILLFSLLCDILLFLVYIFSLLFILQKWLRFLYLLWFSVMFRTSLIWAN